VTLQATVTDHDGRYVHNLTASDFVVTEDGKEQKIALLELSNDSPLSIGILLDTSQSMTSKIKTATAAIDRFLGSLNREDDMFLMTFAGRTDLVQNFTNDQKKISKALKNVQLSNGTVLYDAIEKGVMKVREGKHPKKAILLVTDGQDYGSRVILEQAIDRVRESNVLVYCLGIGAYAGTRNRYPGSNPSGSPQPPSTSRPDGGTRVPATPTPGITPIPVPSDGPILRQFPGRFPGGGRPGGRSPNGMPPGGPGNRPGGFGGRDSADMNVLNSLASASGGKAFLVSTDSRNSRSIDNVLDEISAELRSQYTIGYYPEHPINDGKWHQVVLRSVDTNYDVRARKEYFGGPGK
jgi:VWFA-related protein